MPFSNASVERVFSAMDLLKTKLRNRLICDTVDALLSVRYGLKCFDVTAANFEAPTAMLKKFNVDMYENDDKNDDNDLVFGDFSMPLMQWTACDYVCNMMLASDFIKIWLLCFYSCLKSLVCLSSNKVENCNVFLVEIICLFDNILVFLWRFLRRFFKFFAAVFSGFSRV